MHLKMSSVKWRPFCFGVNVLSWAWLSWLGELWVRFSVYKIIYVIRMYNRNRKCVLKRRLVYHSPVPCLRTANIYVKKPVCIITVCILSFYLMKFICCYVICWINYAWVCVCCNDITLHECICVRRSKHAVLCPNWAGLGPILPASGPNRPSLSTLSHVYSGAGGFVTLKRHHETSFERMIVLHETRGCGEILGPVAI